MIDQDPPLDLAAFDDPLPATPSALPVITATSGATTASQDPRLATEPPAARLVEVANLSANDLAAAGRVADMIDFRQTTTMLSVGEGVLAGIAQASRQLLSGARLGDAGEIGRIAAAVIDGVKILRIEDLQKEASSAAPPARQGLVGRLLGVVSDAHTAFKGFTENRRTFLELMDKEQAHARRIKADLAVTIDLLDQQVLAVRHSLHGLKIAIAGGQLALDRGERELEALRLNAVATGDAADAADVMEFRGALANFRGKVADLREALVGSALLIPVIGQNRKAAETRLGKLSGAMLVVIPRLMAVASQAVVQVDIRNAAAEVEKLDEASRQITRLASRGAHDAATGAARALGGDQRNVEVLAQVANEAIRTMHEVIEIEREVSAGDRDREARLVAIRDRLTTGMQEVSRHAMAPPAASP